MNVFRRKKEGKESGDGPGRASSETETPTIKPSKTFRLGRKNTEPEPKKELDLANALPSSDDFRQSLLMNGLSARFSMLREQDDPNSKIGKASDDSVLFPKRQSRLNDLGFSTHGLSDIAEVSSIHGSVRPPFAFSRADSYGDGYGTDDESMHTGSIMSRPKPGESNVLFGGRQKIYKISAGSSKNLADGGGMGGRALYDNDVSQSAFQKLREKEKQRWQDDDDEHNANASSEFSRPSSPPLTGYNRNRETSSTTSSGPTNTRLSTAATSITSQRTPSLSGSQTPVSAGGVSASNFNAEKPSTKARRLYETGLDQHRQEQRETTMNRIESLSKQRNMGAQTPPLGATSPAPGSSTSNAADKWDRQPMPSMGSMPNLRAASPSPNPSPIGGFDFGVKPIALAVETKPYGYSAPPLSPPVSENDENNVTMQSSNRVKDRAAGPFAKPSHSQDGNKYAERQFPGQHGRETPTFRNNSPLGAFVPRQQAGPRYGNDSNGTPNSPQAQSPSQRHFPPHAQPPNHMHFSPQSQNQRHFPPRDRFPDAQSQKQRMGMPENKAAGPGTFFNSSPSSSSAESPTRSEYSIQNGSAGRPWGLPQPRSFPNLKYRNGPPMGQLPREPSRPVMQANVPEHQNSRDQQNPTAPDSPPMILEITTTPPDEPAPSPEPPIDSPTLPGLSGMVRQHLRSESDSSSIFGMVANSYDMPSDPIEPVSPTSYNAKPSPWDINDWDQETAGAESVIAPLAKMNSAIPVPLAVKPANAENAMQSAPKAAWEMEMEKHHTRDSSSETQKEREDFKNELASRRRQVQENLKSLVEPEQKSSSPTSGVNPLGLLKPKTSRGSIAMKQKEPAGQSKAMRLMGIGSQSPPSGPLPVRRDTDENAWKREEEEMLQSVPHVKTPPQITAFRQARRDAQREREREMAMKAGSSEFNEVNWPNPMRNDPRQQHEPPRNTQTPTDDGPLPNMAPRQRGPSRERKPPPVTHSQRNANRESRGSVATSHSGSRPESRTSRERSGSDASGRSKSRNGRYKDDLAKAMAEGTGSSSQGVIEDLQSARLKLRPTNSGLPPPALSPGMGQPSPLLSSGMGVRPSKSSYFDSQRMQALQTGDALEMGISPRPSPVTPFSVNPTPSLAGPSPVGSRSSTPTGQSFQPTKLAGRKKSVTKSEISEPTLISYTSRISTIDLPSGASLSNGADHAPPIPPVNPKRRQTRAMFGSLIGKKDDHNETHSMPSATPSSDEMSTFSADEDSKPKSKSRQKLRKSSSEGGNMNARARQEAFNAPSPAMPNFPAGAGNPSEGGMF